MKKRLVAMLLSLLMIFTAAHSLAEIIIVGSTIYTGYYINENHFPDEIVREYLYSLSTFARDNQFLRDSSELANLKTMDVSRSSSSTSVWRKGNITNLNGLVFLTNVTTLKCGGNKLERINVGVRPNLTTLLASENQIAEIDLSANSALQFLGLDNNKFTSLDLSGNPNLISINVSHNQLTTLDVSANTALTEINCYNNPLTGLDVSKNTLLDHLDCDNDGLTKLDVSKNINLKDLSCWGNSLTALDVSHNPELTWLDCSVNRISVLDVSECPNMAYLVQNKSRERNTIEGLDYFCDADKGWQLLIDPWVKVIAGSTVSEATAENPYSAPSTDPADETPSPSPADSVPEIGDTFASGGMKYKVTSKTAVSLLGLQQAGSKTNIVIPAAVKVGGSSFKVTEIAAKAFAKDKKLTGVNLGKNIKTIGKNAFNSCEKLKTVKGGTALTAIRDAAFQGCKSLKSVPELKKLQSIGGSAFRNCTSLAKFTFGAAVKTIGKYAFNGCKGLKTITIKTTKLSSSGVGKNAFKGIAAKPVVKCPASKLAKYKKLLLKKGMPKKAVFK